MNIDIHIESAISTSVRAQQLSAMFDVPPAEKCKLEWHGALPIETAPWNVGLIVGPSGSGKSTIARQLFGENYHPEIAWGAASVIDDFAISLKMDAISAACQAVGFNTVPAWLRPFQVLSNGERFRVELARRLLELSDPIVVDEFTSVVDRQVAQIGSHAVQKFARKNKRKFVAVSCHYDIVDWLQPDWIFEPATMHFARRSLQRRPTLDVAISRVPYSAWQLFAPFHYLTAELNRAARCFALFVGDRVASFAGMLYRPKGRYAGHGQEIMGLSRLVTLPDWQGLGLAMILSDKLGAAYKSTGRRMHTYPAHPALIRSFQHSENWEMTKKPGTYGTLSTTGVLGDQRPCAVFEYCGESMPDADAQRLLAA